MDVVNDRRRPNRRPLIAYTILALAMVAGFYRTEQIANRQQHIIQRAALERAQNVENVRRSDARIVSAIRTMLCTLRTNTLTSGQRTPAEKQRVIAFYDLALESVKARPCTTTTQGG